MKKVNALEQVISTNDPMIIHFFNLVVGYKKEKNPRYETCRKALMNYVRDRVTLIKTNFVIGLVDTKEDNNKIYILQFPVEADRDNYYVMKFDDFAYYIEVEDDVKLVNR